MDRNRMFALTITGLLVAIGILIPLYSPLRIVIPPAATYTLGSHAAIFVAMFISPKIAIAVTIGTAIGFFMAFPLVVGLRAASHLIFAILGSIYIARADKSTLHGTKLRIFSVTMALIHAAAEAVTVLLFFFGTSFPAGQSVWWVLGFIGAGTIVHSLVDFELANIVRQALQKSKLLKTDIPIETKKTGKFVFPIIALVLFAIMFLAVIFTNRSNGDEYEDYSKNPAPSSATFICSKWTLSRQ
ncbi:MAG: hypothetical protein FWB74_07740 [Defluviitaleaceae bacterium]|nr:hypothetical protein [Defluviitaleaceae bacterium]